MYVEDSRHHSILRDAFLKAGQLLGFKVLDQNGAAQTGFAPYQFNIKNGKRWTTAQAYLRPDVSNHHARHVNRIVLYGMNQDRIYP